MERRQRNWREAHQLILVKTLESTSVDSLMSEDHFGERNTRIGRILEPKKDSEDLARNRVLKF